MRSVVRVYPGPPFSEFGYKNGALAQLGERLLCKQDVVGSIPSGSTILLMTVITDSNTYVATKRQVWLSSSFEGAACRIFRHRKEMLFCSV